MSLVSQVPTLVGSIGPSSSRPSMSLSTPQSPRRGHMPTTTRRRATSHDSAPVVVVSDVLRTFFPPSTSSSAPTVAASPIVVVASSIHAPDAAFHQLALAEDILLPKSKIVAAIPGAPTSTPASSLATSIATSGASWQSYPSNAPRSPPVEVRPNLPPKQQQPAPLPSPPNSDDAASIVLQGRPRAPSVGGNRNVPCPPMRRSLRPRIRRKPIPRVNASANLRVPTPPLSPAHSKTDEPATQLPLENATLQSAETAPAESQVKEQPRPVQQQPQLLPVRCRLPQPQRRRQVLAGEAARDWLESNMCTMAPLGSCRGPCAPGAPYCAIHSCCALLADRTMCNGPVPNPHLTCICADGYHRENAREEFIVDLYNQRAEREADSVARKEREWAERLEYFDREFGEAIASPYAYQFDSQTQPASGYAPTDRVRANYERMWGAHADDKWWVGEWRFHSTSRV